MIKTRKAIASLAMAAMAAMALTIIPFNALAKGIVPTHLAGTTAEQTAVKIADQTGWTGTAILASSASYGMADALTAGPLAFYLKAPILLTGAGKVLDPATRAELGRLAVKTVYVTSGTAVISQAVLNELVAMDIAVIPLGGLDRAGTSVNIASKMAGVTKVAIANGLQDALSIAAIASAANQPILLTDKDALPASVTAFLAANPDITTSDVIGGTGIIGEAVETALPSATRYAGNTAYDTNNRVIQDFAASLMFEKVYLANGVTGIDALSGAPLAAQTKSAIILTDGTVPATAAFVKGKLTAESVVTALGGAAVVPASVLAEFADEVPVVVTPAANTKIVNFIEIEGIIAENNIDVQINENDRDKSELGLAKLKRSIKDLEDGIEDIDNQRDALRADEGGLGIIIQLGAEKRGLLAELKSVERLIVDQPNLEALTDIGATISDNSQTLSAQRIFILYNQAKLGALDISQGIITIQDQLAAMQLQVDLGMVSANTMNDLKTKLVDMQTKLESNKLTQQLLERQFKDLLNDQENTLMIGSVPALNEEFIIEDEEADLKIALEASFSIKFQVQSILKSQTALDRAMKDHGQSSNEYKAANFELINATLELTKMKNTLTLDYYTMITNITKMQSNLRLVEQNLRDKKVALSDAQLKLNLGTISQLEMKNAVVDFQVQDNAVKTHQIELFNAEFSYGWFLRGMH